MRPSDVLMRATRYLERHGVESPRQTAEVLLMLVLSTDRAGLYSRGEGLSAAQARTFGRALCQRCAGTPLQHLTGEQAFRHLTLTVRPGVFIPRPETEVLVDAALGALRGRAEPVVADVGTGTGAVALALKEERPDATLFATDTSSDAVALARENAERLSLEVTVLQGDLLEPLPDDARGRLDLVVSNPPYVGPAEYEDLPPEVKAEPADALLGGTGVYERLASAAATWLREGGVLAVETGASAGENVAEVLERSFRDVRRVQDLAGLDRVALGVRR